MTVKIAGAGLTVAVAAVGLVLVKRKMWKPRRSRRLWFPGKVKLDPPGWRPSPRRKRGNTKPPAG